MHTQNATHHLRLIMNWEEKGKGIGHFQSYIYIHTQNTTHRLKFMVNWEEKGGGIDWSLTVIHAHMHKIQLTTD